MYSSISYSWKLFAKLFLEKAGSFFAYFLFKESRAGSSFACFPKKAYGYVKCTQSLNIVGSSFAYFSWGKSR